MIDTLAMQDLELVARSHHIGSPRLYPSQRVKSRYFYTQNNYFVLHAGMQTLYGSDSPRPPLQKSVGERLPIRHWAPMLSFGNYFLYGGSTLMHPEHKTAFTETCFERETVCNRQGSLCKSSSSNVLKLAQTWRRWRRACASWSPRLR